MKTAMIPKISSPGRKTLSRRPDSAGLRIRNVLVPIDFSATSLQAVESALPIIRRFGAELHLVHVFATDYPLASLSAIPLIVPELEVGQKVRRRLKEVAAEQSVVLRRENIHAIKGRPFEEICRLAQSLSSDLIVIATRGNTGLKHLALGSTAERVLRFSPCPVLVVRGRAPKRKQNGNGKFGRETVRFQKILVPIDFSAPSRKGLAYAKALAQEFGSGLVLLNSVALQYYVTNDEYARYDFPLVMRQTEKWARDQMRGLMRKTDWGGIRVEASVQVGHPGQQICEHAKDRGADLIVTSTHGHTGLKHVLLGSTAEYVARHASCPVLVVPTREQPNLI